MYLKLVTKWCITSMYDTWALSSAFLLVGPNSVPLFKADGELSELCSKLLLYYTPQVGNSPISLLLTSLLTKRHCHTMHLWLVHAYSTCYYIVSENIYDEDQQPFTLWNGLFSYNSTFKNVLFLLCHNPVIPSPVFFSLKVKKAKKHSLPCY